MIQGGLCCCCCMYECYVLTFFIFVGFLRLKKANYKKTYILEYIDDKKKRKSRQKENKENGKKTKERK